MITMYNFFSIEILRNESVLQFSSHTFPFVRIDSFERYFLAGIAGLACPFFLGRVSHFGLVTEPDLNFLTT
jgi:hypothetical protein